MEPQHYKLSILRRIKGGARWENIYFEINGKESKIIAYETLQSEEPINSKLEKISTEEVDKVLRDLRSSRH